MMDPEFIYKLLKVACINQVRKIKAFFKNNYIEMLIIGVFMGFPYIIGQDLKAQMLEYGGDKSGSIVIFLMWLLCLLVSFIFAIFSLNIFHKWSRIAYRICCFIFLIILFLFYLIVARHCAYPICLLNPIYFIPILIIFMLAIRGTKRFYLYLMLFLLPFISFIVADKFYEIRFINYCKINLPQNELNPIYLPKEYFHKERFGLVPNFEDLKGDAKVLERNDLNKFNIYTNVSCKEIDKNLENNIVNNKYIVVCILSYDYYITRPLYRYFHVKIVGTEYDHKNYWYIGSPSSLTKRILPNADAVKCQGTEYGDIIQLEH